MLVTCLKCGTNIVQTCTCFKGREKLKEFIKLSLREHDIVDKTQFENKSLFIEVAEKSLVKEAKIEKINTFHMRASASFNGKELENLSDFTIRLLDWDRELVYWHKEKNDLTEPQDSYSYEWNLELYRFNF